LCLLVAVLCSIICLLKFMAGTRDGFMSINRGTRFHVGINSEIFQN
jgi:hypothetical protein